MLLSFWVTGTEVSCFVGVRGVDVLEELDNARALVGRLVGRLDGTVGGFAVEGAVTGVAGACEGVDSASVGAASG